MTEVVVSDEEFVKMIKDFIGDDESKIRELAREFQVSLSSVKRWEDRISLPQQVMRKYVVEVINKLK